MTYKDITKTGIHFITEPISVPDGTHLHAEPDSRLVGGVRLHAKDAGNGLWECSLGEAGITPAAFVSRGYGRKILPAHNELFITGKPLFIAQYPKRGQYLTVKALGNTPAAEGQRVTGPLEDGFSYDDPRPGQWEAGQEIWMLGYWCYDWAPSRERVKALDTERGFVSVDIAAGRNRVTEGQRFCFYNVREEVTEPGDYCVDFVKGTILFRPYPDTDMEKAEILLSVCDKPVFAFDHAKDITIEGFTIEAFRGMGVTVKDSENIVIRDCEIRNIGNRAVCVDDSREVTVTHCHIHDTGDGGVAYYCGDRKTLTRADCRVTYCHFHNIASWDRCYEPPIRLYGVGLTAQYNIIHDCPHSAVLFGGNELSVCDNEIYRVVMETGDAGAVYGGRDYTFRGNEVSRNFIHHVGSGVGMGTMGIYNDDAISGTRMENNVFYKVQRAVFLGGGVDFLVQGNIFVDCYPSVEIDGRAQSDAAMWRNMVIHTLYDRFYHVDGSDVSAAEGLYLQKYPELAKIDAYYRENREPHIPPSAEMKHNLFCSEQKISYTWDTKGGFYTEWDNKDITREALKEYLTPHQYDVICGNE